MATRAVIRDDDPERERQQHDQAPESPAVPRLVRPARERTPEEILALIDAAIEEEWDRMEPAMRYLADR